MTSVNDHCSGIVKGSVILPIMNDEIYSDVLLGKLSVFVSVLNEIINWFEVPIGFICIKMVIAINN